MQIEVKFVCPELVGPLRSGAYDLPEGATILELLEKSRSEHPGLTPETATDYLLFLLNGKSAQMHARLSHGDKLYVLRKIFGG